MSSYLFKIATQEPAMLLEAVTAALGEDSRIARQVREQMPKSTITEPTEFGSIVRAGLDGVRDRVLWQRHEEGWTSKDGAYVSNLDWLDHPEVLRVGIGGLPPLTAADLSRMSIEANAARNGPHSTPAPSPVEAEPAGHWWIATTFFADDADDEKAKVCGPFPTKDAALQVRESLERYLWAHKIRKGATFCVDRDPQAEAVEADKAHWLPEHLRGDGPCFNCGTLDNPVWFTDSEIWNGVVRRDPGAMDQILCFPCFVTAADIRYEWQITGWSIQPEWREDAAPEPPPVQVEAEPKSCTLLPHCGLEDGHAGWCLKPPPAIKHGVDPALAHQSAPAEDDPIEALVQEIEARVTDVLDRTPRVKPTDILRAFAARVLEVGGQQPGVPVEELRALAQHWRADNPDNHTSYVLDSSNRAAWQSFARAATQLEALLPAEPSTADKEPTS